MLNPLELTGRAQTHVVYRRDLDATLHHEVVAPFLAMKSHAALDGIDIEIVSGFRDFAAQQRIWDRKFRGEMSLYDNAGIARDATNMSDAEKVAAITLWSAVPGASRHHWGTDFDVIDYATLPEGYRLRLMPDEFAPGNLFHKLHLWLNANMARFGFFRPYQADRGGVQPEPWHLSYAPIAKPALALMTPELFEETVRASDMLGKEHVLRSIHDIHRRYVANVDEPAFWV